MAGTGQDAQHLPRRGRHRGRATGSYARDDLAARGVEVRRGDYDEPASLRAAFDGADRLLFISSPPVEKRVAQHRNVVITARDAGVGSIAYTSGLGAAMVDEGILSEHHATEQASLDSGVPYTFLPHPIYTEVIIDPELLRGWPRARRWRTSAAHICVRQRLTHLPWSRQMEITHSIACAYGSLHLTANRGSRARVVGRRRDSCCQGITTAHWRPGAFASRTSVVSRAVAPVISASAM